MKKIILASGSPRRKQLLEWAEIAFDVLVSDADESYPAGMNFKETAVYIARNKALAVAAIAQGDHIILAADTIVVCNDRIIGKPTDRADAIQILTQLSGNTHQVITGVVMLNGSIEHSFADLTT
ncbi:MAG: septum formation inhibitor Maf, partial [Chitinophagaceae bacterium]